MAAAIISTGRYTNEHKQVCETAMKQPDASAASQQSKITKHKQRLNRTKQKKKCNIRWRIDTYLGKWKQQTLILLSKIMKEELLWYQARPHLKEKYYICILFLRNSQPK